MNRLNRLLIISTFTILLSACGGGEDASDEAAAEAVGVPAETEKAYNPLASEQQLIRDAQAIQGILNKDAEKKKKAADEIN